VIHTSHFFISSILDCYVFLSKGEINNSDQNINPHFSQAFPTLTWIIIVHTIIHVKTEFDPNKDRLNIAKHGISLVMADQLEWDLMMCSEDNREA
jgi:hypothetical protein